MKRISTSAAVVVCQLFASSGCMTDPPVGSGVPQPSVPEYILYGSTIGVWQELERLARIMPPALNDLPGVDGIAPLPTEWIKHVGYRDTPQRELELEIHRPAVNDGLLRRGIVFYSGGGFVVDRDFDTLTVWADYLASRGFVVFNTRQRVLLEEGVTRRDVFTDGIAAARYVCANADRFGADPDRLALLGRSSGGQLALLVAMVPTPEHFGEAGDPSIPLDIKAVVDILGPTDDARLFNSDDYSVLPRSAVAAVYGGTPDQVPEAYRESAPLTYVRPGLPPTMIVHGALDTTVPPIQAGLLADMLEASGNEVERAFYPDFGHALGWGLINNDALTRVMPRIIDFLGRKL